MRQLGIQIALIAGTLAIAWRLLTTSGQRVQALRRLGLLLLAAFAIWSIVDPNGGPMNWLANLLGVGRAADLVLYGLVVAFFGFVVTTFKRFRDMEIRYTRLARRLALDEAVPPADHARLQRGTGAAPASAGTLDPPAPPPTHSETA